MADAGIRKTAPLPDRLPLDEAIENARIMLSDTLAEDTEISEAAAYLSGSCGKGIRSRLLLTCAGGEDGILPSSALYAAVAVELFHLATLVHDDIIDDADTRRGIPSVQKKFGKRSAVIIGDYILCMAMSAAFSAFEGGGGGEGGEDKNYSLIKKYALSLKNICLGEFNQLKNNGNVDLSVYQYLRIINGKTAELFRISALSGALIGGAGEEEAVRFGLFGRYLGLVFQIIDDCKDYELAEEAALKPVKHDLAQGVVTLPLILAVMREPSLKPVFKNSFLSGACAGHIKAVREYGGIAGAKVMALRYARKAERIVREYGPFKRDRLLEILSKALDAAPEGPTTPNTLEARFPQRNPVLTEWA